MQKRSITVGSDRKTMMYQDHLTSSILQTRGVMWQQRVQQQWQQHQWCSEQRILSIQILYSSTQASFSSLQTHTRHLTVSQTLSCKLSIIPQDSQTNFSGVLPGCIMQLETSLTWITSQVQRLWFLPDWDSSLSGSAGMTKPLVYR